MEEGKLTPRRCARVRVKTTQPMPAASSAKMMTSTTTPAVFMAVLRRAALRKEERRIDWTISEVGERPD